MQQLDKVENDKQKKHQELLMSQESKMIIDSIKQMKTGFKGFVQTQFSLKRKEQRFVSLLDEENL